MENVSSRCGNRDSAPRLRFPEFRGEWLSTTLGAIGTFTKGAPLSKADIASEGTPFILYGELYTTYKEVTTEIKRRTLKTANDECMSRVGDVIIPTSGETPDEIATATCIMVSNVILAGDLNIYRNSTIDGRFISYIINHVINGDISRIAQGKSVVHIKASELAKLRINYPSRQEQNKIIDFLMLLNRKIAKQQSLINALKTYKRGVSEAIFERKVGFPNKTNWKKIKIENLFSERCERAIGNEELLAVTINGGIQKRNEIQLKDNSSEDKSNYKRVHIGDIAYNTMRMWQGASGVSCYAGIVSPAYTVIVLKDKENQCIDFWGHYFKHTNLIRTFQKFSQGLTSDTWNLKYTQLSQINLYVPEYKEQCAIANFLHKFDSKISIEEKKLSQLSMLKNELLHRMFI